MDAKAMPNDSADDNRKSSPIPNLPTISAEEIHAANLAAFRLGNKARYHLNRGLLLARARRVQFLLR